MISYTFSTKNAVIPFGPASALVLAYTTKTSASGPFVIQNLVPFNIYLSPRKRKKKKRKMTNISLN